MSVKIVLKKPCAFTNFSNCCCSHCDKLITVCTVLRRSFLINEVWKRSSIHFIYEKVLTDCVQKALIIIFIIFFLFSMCIGKMIYLCDLIWRRLLDWLHPTMLRVYYSIPIMLRKRTKSWNFNNRHKCKRCSRSNHRLQMTSHKWIFFQIHF